MTELCAMLSRNLLNKSSLSYLRFIYLSIFLLVFYPQFALSQFGANDVCGFDTSLTVNKQVLVMGLPKNVNTERQAEILIIPTVVHIIHLGEPLGFGTNITEAQVLSAINALNEDFRMQIGTNGYGLGVDTEIEFCLVKRDTLGSPTNGITRTDASSVPGYLDDGIKSGNIGLGADEIEIKSLVAWPRSEYLNIFVVTEIDGNNAGNGTQGFSYFPFDDVRDGVTLLYNTFGTVGNLKSWSNLNRTLTHEVGHYLGLYHTFHNTNSQSACDNEVSCDTQGDQVCDTPPTMANHSCVIPPSCSSAQLENYMDYTAQECKNTFTLGQTSRMRNTLFTQRLSLLNTNACVPVSLRDLGIDGVTNPENITCSNFSFPSVQVVNYGTLPASIFSIQAVLDATDTVSVVWNGSLSSGASIEVYLDSLAVSMGPHLVDFSVTWLADGVDEWSQNNIFSKSFTREALEHCTVIIEPDYFATETTWELTDENEVFIMGGGPYSNTSPTNIYERSTCLVDGCYNFRVFDAFGDGMSFGGGYEVLNGAGEVWVSGSGNFGSVATHILCVGPVPGCMYSFSANYNPNATYDDGSCYLQGCLDSVACNYSPVATVDDGSCVYASFNCAGDLDNSGHVNISDLLLFLTILGTPCN
ncbi:MAG: hypothetical protein COA49_05025 [Bacteroidetes bacterium]|nr:MAG: hypothetical protein COA49_05025 [Bacteroidota bacterium]